MTAARQAALPAGCAATVYLCDDGRDPKKRKWVDALADPGVVYVSGRKRPPGEMNGAGGVGWGGGDEKGVVARAARHLSRPRVRSQASPATSTT